MAHIFILKNIRREHPQVSVIPQDYIVRILQKKQYDDYSFWRSRMTTIAIAIPQNLQQFESK
ncbi:hypothetical protein [Pseudanabaena sp. BC1403]|uniref:hypothetical protein n=1 Tax=Pseudanabaena sp. BC1403 TaxID=2043171 RepID=UPI0015E1B090|nr:hypothetical protein [Pseudanabaena sp. BC1403]